MNKIKKWTWEIAGLVLISLTFVQNTSAQSSSDTVTNMRSQSMTVPLYKSRLISLDRVATRISVGNPDVADILILRSKQLYVLGKDLGTTNVLLWDQGEQLIGTIEVEVTHDLQSLKKNPIVCEM